MNLNLNNLQNDIPLDKKSEISIAIEDIIPTFKSTEVFDDIPSVETMGGDDMDDLLDQLRELDLNDEIDYDESCELED